MILLLYNLVILNVCVRNNNKKIRKKSKTPTNFIKLSKLRTRMSLGPESRAKSENNSKLNKLCKFVSNKLADFTKKAIKPVTSLANDTREILAISFPMVSDDTDSSSGVYNATPKPADDEAANTIQTEQPQRQPDAAKFYLNEAATDPAAPQSKMDDQQQSQSASKSENVNYVPKLSGREYQNRYDRLNELNRLVSTSKTKFIFI